MVFVYRVKSMDPICFCNYVFLSWLLYVILYWSLSVLSCWDSFFLLCIKQLSSNDTRVNNILRMLVVWWAIITTNCEICIPCPHMPCPSEYFLSPTGQQVTAGLGHQLLLWETAFYYDMADDWSKNQLWNWLISHQIVFPNIHPFQPEVLSPTFTHWVFSWRYMPVNW